jgi:hypothetical protein
LTPFQGASRCESMRVGKNYRLALYLFVIHYFKSICESRVDILRKNSLKVCLQMRRGYIQLQTLFGKVLRNGDYRLARLASQNFKRLLGMMMTAFCKNKKVLL